MERKLDEVEEGRLLWTDFLHGFYGDFKVSMEKAEAEMNRVQKPVEEMDELCPECGRNLVIRTGRFGRFISCSGFPECRYRRSFMNKTGALCPQCNGDLVERKTKQKKRVFYGCSNYPTCNFALWERPVPDLCPRCGGLMVVPRVGQEPVCYAEFIATARTEETKPQVDGTSPQRTTRRKTVAAEGENHSTEPRTTRRTATRKKVEDGVSTGKPTTAAKKTTSRTTARKTTTARPTAKKTTSTRAAAAKKSSVATSKPATTRGRAAKA